MSKILKSINWKKRKKKISQDGVISYKLNKKELKQYLEELENKEIVRV